MAIFCFPRSNVFSKFAVVLAVTLLLIAPSTSAQSQESIKNFEVGAKINNDSSIRVTERIIYDFGLTQKHGLYRDIPVKYDTVVGHQFLRVSDITVTDGMGNKYPFEIANRGRYQRIKIGDPESLVSGVRIYVVEYTITGALGYFEEYDELYWNATGNEWSVPVLLSKATVFLPGGVSQSSIQSACYIGVLGGTESCDTHLIATGSQVDQVMFETGRELKPGEGLTVAVGFPKGMVDEPNLAEKAANKVYDNWVVLFPVVVFAVMFRLWYIKGRDPKGRGVIVAEYEVPEDLFPLEISVIINGKFQNEDLSSEIIRLAIVGHLAIKQLKREKRFWSSDKDYEFTNLQKEGEISPAEAMLVTMIFGGQKKILLSELKKGNFYLKMDKIRKYYTDAVVAKGYFHSDPNKIRLKYLLVGTGIVFLAGILVSAVNSLNILTVVAFVASLAIVWSFALAMPQLSSKGVEVRDKLFGLKEYLQIAEKDRLKFHNAPEKNPQLFEKFLPYAMVLGVEKSWAKEFEDIQMPPPRWYHGVPTTALSSITFVEDISSFNDAVAVNMVSAPGSSSGSSGGGFSGGGGGGGGGGSW